MTHDDIWLFIGDSITDASRTTDRSLPIGNGYVSLIDGDLGSEYADVSIINRGIAGDTTDDLAARWERDCLDIGADVVSILIGVNDAAAKAAGSIDTFEAVYRDLLRALVKRNPQRIVLVQPFLWPANKEQLGWVDDVRIKAETVGRLASEFSATLVPAYERLGSSRVIGASPFSDDGVHLNDDGNDALASLWIESVLPV